MHPTKTAWVLLSFMASLSALGTLAPGAHARASEVELPVRLPQAKALGMKTSVHRLGDGTVKIRIDDLVTQEATEILENSRSLTRESRQFDAKGRVLEVVSITPGVIVTEDYLAQPPKKTQRTFDEHTEGAANYDAVYGLQFCCFGIDASSALTMQPSERETFTGSRFVCESVLNETHGQPRGR